MGENLFVYGTLRRGSGHPLARFLGQRADFLGRGAFQGRLYDLGRYPGAVASADSRDLVFGDLYGLREPGPVLEVLDRYEGCGAADAEYVRRLVTVTLEEGCEVTAWIYLCNRQPLAWCKRIASGRYGSEL